MEFALVAIPFFFITFATIDLGRYFLTQHSLRTVTSEAVRAALVNCYRAIPCSLSAGQFSTVKATAPFLVAANVLLTVTEASNGNGTNTITASGQYPFSFFMPVWVSLTGTISESTNLTY